MFFALKGEVQLFETRFRIVSFANSILLTLGKRLESTLKQVLVGGQQRVDDMLRGLAVFWIEIDCVIIVVQMRDE